MESVLARAQAALDEGHTARAAGDLDGAERAYARAAALAPLAPQPVHGLAVVAQLRGDWPAAEANFRRALELEPGRAVSRANLGVALLAQGRFAEGFPLADAWRELPERQAKAAPVSGLPYPLWRGEDLAGKRLLVWGEEGFGDQIMYARFAALLRDRGAHVTWLCPPPLARLFREGLDIDVIAAEGTVDLGQHDFVCPSASLPAVLMPELVDPPAAPYIGLPTPQPIPGARIGIVAKGNPKHRNDRKRSLPGDLAVRLTSLAGAIDLAPEATGAKDFYETARIVAGLELVISVDTAVAHLTGALGKPLWVLVSEPADDWRWLQGREDSPWYSTAKVIRQPRPGDWAETLNELIESGHGN
jgi:tetratricopeptide (TPR) repeat protein